MPKLVIEGGPQAGQEVSLAGDRITIGREAELSLRDGKVSRHHARIQRDGDRFALVDLGSRNGTLLNGTRVTRQLLQDGDRIRLGNTTLRFQEESRAAPATPTEVPAGGAAEREPTLIFIEPRTRPPVTLLWEDLSQRGGLFRLGLILLGLAAAVAVFLVVARLTEGIFG